MRKRIWLRLGLILLAPATVALVGCPSNVGPTYDFEGSWTGGPVFQSWDFNSNGGTYTAGFGIYTFNFSYVSVDENENHILIQITSVSGLRYPPYISVGAQVYVMYSISGDQSGDQMYITFSQDGYATPGSGDGPFTKE